jgi:hypothetical protein
MARVVRQPKAASNRVGFGLLLSLFAPKRFERYDPTWLVEAAEAEFPGAIELHDALRQCTKASVESTYYTRFVRAFWANRAGSHWQFSHNVVLENTEHGEVVLDVLKSGRVGGVEFLAKLLEGDS